MFCKKTFYVLFEAYYFFFCEVPVLAIFWISWGQVIGLPPNSHNLEGQWFFCQGFPFLRGFMWLPSHCCFSLDPHCADQFVLYGCEAWKLTAAEEKKLGRFQFTCLKQILRIWWLQHIRDNTISQVTGVKKISDEIRRRRWNWVGHMLRKERKVDCMLARGMAS